MFQYEDYFGILVQPIEGWFSKITVLGINFLRRPWNWYIEQTITILKEKELYSKDFK